MTGFTAKSFDLLDGLAQNNSKEWFDPHREDFEGYLRTPFAEMLAAASDLLAGTDRPLLGGPRTMFRQNRDVRFSKDKSPYKTGVSGMLTPSGTKSEMGGIVYAQLDSGGGFIGAGYYQLPNDDLTKVRDRILSRPDQFDMILAGIEASDFALSAEGALKRMPRGYEDHAGHRHADALRLKSFLIAADMPKIAWTDGRLPQALADLAQIAAPLIAFCASALTD